MTIIKKVTLGHFTRVPNGVSINLANSFVEGLKTKQEVDVHMINVATELMRGCAGCARHEDIWCSQDDLCFATMKELIEADLVVFAYPVQWQSIPGDLKNFIDRTVMLYNWADWTAKKCIADKFTKKQFVCLVTCHNSGAETAIFPVKTFVGFLKSKLDTYIVNDSQELSFKTKGAKEFGEKIGQQL
ncbi:hypothetical protein EIN_032630 [Entamoeba invadens IP1]|uniref:Flavodoxin-like fold domain-containing protein n=1 Tax=Entamoeba invadens IP1 TaxID=370355 RepID=A0A0A1TY79_ENTIV|nr:hypothetical protein EIN_032630 [Entamoeba invadens IP1]ELP86472.1 hypothetical protein EIN_032630 [Entamoeba invadens IP1]|eukprot:XP_004185818.1 hypothetical protein EIN_032630 [Entamoeba invadens IP1]